MKSHRISDPSIDISKLNIHIIKKCQMKSFPTIFLQFKKLSDH
jgi:hypothetical protein